MPSFRQVRVLALLLGVLASSACTDRAATDLVASAPSARAIGSRLPTADLPGLLPDPSGLSLQAIWWDNQLRGEVSVTRTIGAEGGTISIPQTGLTMVFPAGAVRKPTKIKITADSRYVAYKMEPTGTQFLKDVTVTQLLRPTQLFGHPLQNELYAAYIADDGISLSGKIPVIEIEPSRTIFSLLQPLLPEAQVWIIRHFSRYMLASG